MFDLTPDGLRDEWYEWLNESEIEETENRKETDKIINLRTAALAEHDDLLVQENS